MIIKHSGAVNLNPNGDKIWIKGTHIKKEIVEDYDNNYRKFDDSEVDLDE